MILQSRVHGMVVLQMDFDSCSPLSNVMHVSKIKVMLLLFPSKVQPRFWLSLRPTLGEKQERSYDFCQLHQLSYKISKRATPTLTVKLTVRGYKFAKNFFGQPAAGAFPAKHYRGSAAPSGSAHLCPRCDV